MADTKPIDITFDELTTPQTDSDDPEYLAYVAGRIRQGQEDIKQGRVVSFADLKKEFGVCSGKKRSP